MRYSQLSDLKKKLLDPRFRENKYIAVSTEYGEMES